jgi:uncharacterized protein YggE
MFIPTFIIAIIAMLALGSAALAQEDATSTPTPAPMDETPMPPPTMDAPAASDSTLVVMGSGSAAGAPDQANIEIGVEIMSDSVSEAFGEANSTIDDIIQALVDLGIAREDIQTTGLNIYTQQGPMGPDASSNQTQYSISNRVRVIVRDVSQIEDVIDTAVSNGANNIFGLNFAFSDPTELIRDARAAAVENAQANAEHLAELLGLTLGNVINVSENRGGGVGPYPVETLQMGGGAADSAVVESGQLSVSLQVELTYSVHNAGE